MQDEEINDVVHVRKCEGLEIEIRQCNDALGCFRIEVRTPEEFYKYGDYAKLEEAQNLAQTMIDSRSTWRDTSSGDYWRPSVWQTRTCPRGGTEFWRRGPLGSTLSIRQPHGIDSYWRMYWEISPIVCGHDDQGIFDTPFEAIGVLERLAGDGMRTVLLD
jgi:hypothetical protein